MVKNFRRQKENLEFARRTEKAYREIEKGYCTKMSFDNFIAEMKKW